MKAVFERHDLIMSRQVSHLPHEISELNRQPVEIFHRIDFSFMQLMIHEDEQLMLIRPSQGAAHPGAGTNGIGCLRESLSSHCALYIYSNKSRRTGFRDTSLLIPHPFNPTPVPFFSPVHVSAEPPPWHSIYRQGRNKLNCTAFCLRDLQADK
jgi:hypothetical protein